MIGEFGPVITRTIDLGYDQLLVLEHRRGARVRVLHGALWLTEEGRTQDVFAASGDEVAVQTRGRALIEGLGVARIQVIEPVAIGAWTRVSTWLGRQRARIGNLVAAPSVKRGAVKLAAAAIATVVAAALLETMSADTVRAGDTARTIEHALETVAQAQAAIIAVN